MSGTATVEVLTAEVRVLMIGSRQVTLSVARQLDYVALDKIEPFGRVKLGIDDEYERIIGRSQKDGTLVLARADRYPHRTPWLNETDLDPENDRLPVVCDREFSRDGSYRLKFHTREIQLSERAATRCGKHSLTSKDRCGAWEPSGHGAHIQAAIEAWDESCAVHDRARALPLIVLAGLK